MGTRDTKINPGNELGGQEIKNNNTDKRQVRICFTNLIFSNSIAINCFNLLQI